MQTTIDPADEVATAAVAAVAAACDALDTVGVDYEHNEQVYKIRQARRQCADFAGRAREVGMPYLAATLDGYCTRLTAHDNAFTLLNGARSDESLEFSHKVRSNAPVEDDEDLDPPY